MPYFHVICDEEIEAKKDLLEKGRKIATNFSRNCHKSPPCFLCCEMGCNFLTPPILHSRKKIWILNHVDTRVHFFCISGPEEKKNFCEAVIT